MHETELHRLIALVVFVGTYVGLGIGRLPPFRVDRTGVAMNSLDRSEPRVFNS